MISSFVQRGTEMDFRHELKFQVNPGDVFMLRGNLRAVMKGDPYAKNGSYGIRSLYFDTPSDQALRDKLNSVNVREKFRLRFYDGDTSLINLEKKFKANGLGNKQKARLSADETQALLEGDISWMLLSEKPLIRELYAKMRVARLQPKVIVDYRREPYVFGPGNVRVTLDSCIRTGLRCVDFLDPNCLTVPVSGNPLILEVKWDRYLPDVVRNAVGLPSRRAAAFSKYAQSRMYE